MSTNPAEDSAMTAPAYKDTPAEYRTFTEGRKWFSSNDDKAWAEKFYLIFTPIFLIYNGLVIEMKLLDVNNFWHVTQNLMMWLPYCVILPLILRRNCGIPLHKQWWVKFQVYMAVIVFVLTYFNTEFFFEILGMRYNFPQVTLYFDSALLGPDQATALAEHKRIPVGMYLNTMAFFTVYHIAAIVVIRRMYNAGLTYMGAFGKRAGFVVAAAIAAFFFAWGETYLYQLSGSSHDNVWYINLPWQLKVGSWFYMTYFVFLFPNIYWMDEDRDHAPWRIWRVIVESAAMCMFIVSVDDLWVLVGLPVVPTP